MRCAWEDNTESASACLPVLHTQPLIHDMDCVEIPMISCFSLPIYEQSCLILILDMIEWILVTLKKRKGRI